MALEPASGDLRQEFKEAAQEATVPHERAAEPQVEAPEAPEVAGEIDIDAARDAEWARLDGLVQSGKIDKHEAYYQRQHWETDGVGKPTSSAERAAAIEAIMKGSQDRGPEQEGPDLSRKTGPER